MKKLSILAILVIAISSCNKEKSNWDLDVVAPLVWAEFGLSDIIGDSILSNNSDNSISILLNKEILNFKPDTLIRIPDTTITNSYTLPPLIPSIGIEPGNAFPVSTGDLELTPGDGIEISEAVVSTGSIVFNMLNPFQTPIIISYLLPRVTLDGEPLNVVDTLAPAVGTTPSISTNTIILDNYSMDLTGVDGDTYNEMAQEFSATNHPDGIAVVFHNTDSIKLNLEMNAITFSYIKGYFGNIEINQEGNFNIEQLSDIPSNALIFEESSLSLNIKNGLGVDIRINESSFVANNTSENIELDIMNTQLNGTINIDRALDIGGEPQYSSRVVTLDENNSNIIDMIATSADNFEFAINAELNPLGNISSSNNFLYKEHGIIIDANLDIPLNLNISDLNLNDTLEFSFENADNNSTFNEGELSLFFENSFPFDLTIDLILLEDVTLNSSILIDNQTIYSCDIANNCNTQNSIIKIPLTSNQLDILNNNGKLLITGTFNSDGSVSIMPDQSLKFRAVIDASINTGF